MTVASTSLKSTELPGWHHLASLCGAFFRLAKSKKLYCKHVQYRAHGMARRGQNKPAETKRELFVVEYLKDLNATQAAIRSGYSPATAAAIGNKLLKDCHIAARVKEAIAIRSERASVDAQWVLNNFVNLHARCMQEEPVRDKEGNETGEYKFDSGGAVRALENIGKHVGFYEKDNKQKGTLAVVIQRDDEAL